MRIAVGFVVAVAVASTLSIGGCSRRSDAGAVQEAHPGQTPAALNARIETIMKVPVPQARDAALREIARDAADSGQPDICAKALAHLSVPAMRKQIGELCSTMLKAKGDSAGAAKVAAVR